MVLEHVAHRAGTVVVTAPVFHADGFGGGDFHVVDVVPVPERLEQAVGEAQHQQVLHGFFAEVVVDTVNLVFEEVVVDGCVQLARGLRIVAKGFFHDETFPAVVFAVQAVRSETGGDDAVETGRGGKIVEGIAAGLVFGVQGIKTWHEFAVIVAVGGVERLVIEAGAEIIQRCSACIFLVDEVLPHGVTEGGVIQLAAAHAENGEFVRQLVVFVEMIEGGDELAAGEIAGGAEDNDDVVGGFHEGSVVKMGGTAMYHGGRRYCVTACGCFLK